MGGSIYLRIAIGHVLHHAPRRKPAAFHGSRWSRSVVSDAIDGDVDHGPSALA